MANKCRFCNQQMRPCSCCKDLGRLEVRVSIGASWRLSLPLRPSHPPLTYFPLTFPLDRLAQATGFLIPVSPLLLEMLHWAELHKPPKSATGGGAGDAADTSLQLRAGKTVLRTPRFQEEVITQVCIGCSWGTCGWTWAGSKELLRRLFHSIRELPSGHCEHLP